jgi:hypothetical protein
MRHVLEEVLSDPTVEREALEAVEKIGDSAFQGPSSDIIFKVRQALHAEFKVSSSITTAASADAFDANLWEALLMEAEDPETEVPEWMRSGCPIGTKDSVIKACGIFPLAEKASRAVEQSKTFAKLAECSSWSQGSHANYKSFYEGDGKFASQEVERIHLKGFIQKFMSWAEVIAQ